MHQQFIDKLVDFLVFLVLPWFTFIIKICNAVYENDLLFSVAGMKQYWTTLYNTVNYKQNILYNKPFRIKNIYIFYCKQRFQNVFSANRILTIRKRSLICLIFTKKVQEPFSTVALLQGGRCVGVGRQAVKGLQFPGQKQTNKT